MSVAAVVKEATMTPEGAQASYVLTLGSRQCRLSYNWEAAGPALVLKQVEVSLDEEAKAVYRQSDRYGGQLKLEWENGGPYWLFDELPLVLNCDLYIGEENISAYAAQDNQHLLDSWASLYTRRP